MDNPIVMLVIAAFVLILGGIAYWAFRKPKDDLDIVEGVAPENNESVSSDIAYTSSQRYPSSYTNEPQYGSPERPRYKPAPSLRAVPGKPGLYTRGREDDADEGMSVVGAATLASLDFPDSSPSVPPPVETPSYRTAADPPGVAHYRYTHTSPDVDTPAPSHHDSYSSHGSSYGASHDTPSSYDSSPSYSSLDSSSSSSSDSGSSGSSSC